MNVLIRVDHLLKVYGTERAAVDDLSFEVCRGEVLGFLGPNGAGKTTTMRILASSLAPTAGYVEVAGHDVHTHSLEARCHVGYLPEGTPLYRDMTVHEYLDFIADLRGLPKSGRRVVLRRVVEQCGLEQQFGQLIGELSKGYRQRVGLAQAIMHEPDVLILDELTAGLDPNQIAAIRGVIKEIGKQKTVILSTHILGEVQACCSRVIVISDGKLVADGTPEELGRKYRGGSELLVEIGSRQNERVDPVALLRTIDGVEEVRVTERVHGSTLQLRVRLRAGCDPRGEIARRITAQASMDLLRLTPERATLEAVFHQLTVEEPA